MIFYYLFSILLSCQKREIGLIFVAPKDRDLKS